MLPNASFERLSLVDALFTSTSAVCVTGLIVVDTATYFTDLGIWIIMILIQIGGLGIMTFAGFIGHMFSGGASFQQRFLLGQFSNAEKLGEVMKTIYKIILITITVEALGAMVIFQSLPEGYFDSLYDKLFFSVFHSISAFCNAGFSTLSLGMYDVYFRFNYPLLLILAFLLIFGGLGFPIMLNLYNYVKHQLKNIFDYIFRNKNFRHVPYILNFNSKLILISTLFLILAGWVGFFILEYDGVLREHSFIGKIVTAFFGGTSPRTAGFNSVNMPDLMFSTVFLNILLMYIGASPGGTGGGIKTTTFSVMIINFWSIASGKDKIFALGHEIKNDSVNRAFSILSLSLIVLGMSITVIHSLQPGLDFIHVIFECFSAFSTVGLSMGITAQLSDANKVIVCLLMFIGRIGVLTFLSAFLFKKSQDLIRYPKEEVIY
jgi:potassium uptake TrkH family protein